MSDFEGMDVYQGFFSSQRSFDLIMKIFFSLCTFVILLFATAWHITKKNYRLPVGPPKPVIGRLSDLFSDSCRRQVATLELRQCYKDVIGFPVSRRLVAVVNSIQLAEVHRRDGQLDGYFSCVPGSLCNSWRGVLFTRPSYERKVIRKLSLYTFESLPLSIISRAVSTVVAPGAHSSITLPCSAVRAWSKRLMFDLLLGGKCCAPGECAFGHGTLVQLAGDLDVQMTGLRCLHMGRCSQGTQICHCPDLGPDLSVDGLPLIDMATGVRLLLAPTVRHAMETFDESRELNWVSAFIQNKADMEDHGTRVGFLTVTHLCHLVAECALIGRDMLGPALEWAVFLLAGNAAMQAKIAAEWKVMEKEPTDQLQMALDANDSLVNLKSLVHESLRLACPGVDYDLRLAERDGQLGCHDYREGDVILFNQVAMAQNTELWGRSCRGVNASQPDPERFISEDGLFSLPDVWSRLGLADYTVFIPGDFLVHALALLVGPLCRNYRVMPANGAGLDVQMEAGFLVLPQPMPDFTFLPLLNVESV